MKKILKALACVTAVAGMLFSNVQGVFAADATYEIVTDKATVNVDDTFTVTVNVKNNPGINAITAYLDYDADKIQAVGAVSVSDVAVNFISNETLNSQINLVPTSANSDYTALGADGVKTAAQLGRIKVAGYLYDGSKLVESTKDGALFAVKFKVIATGDAKITFTNIKTSGYSSDAITNQEVANSTGTVTAGSGSSTNPENPGGSTYTYKTGDVDLDNQLTSTDAALIIKCTLNPEDPSVPFDKNDNYRKIADVDGDAVITSTDAALVIKKTLNEAFVFVVGDTVQSTENLNK